MSVLAVPRIYFKGQIAWDPIVTNNYDTLYNEDTGEPVFTQATDRVKAFREEAIARVASGNWNPHGTHRSNFFDTEVTGYDVGKGRETSDPFVSSAVNLTGMLVDLEPYGAYSSQVFFDSMLFGVEGGYCVSAPRTTRFTARYINFARNSFNKMIAGVASVVWQTSFAKADGLKINPFDSDVLRKLAKELECDDVLGLTVRFNAYRTVYYDDSTLRNTSESTKAAAKALQDKLNGGGFQPNPARSLLVGVLGLWHKDEPLHEPGDRSLNQTPTSALGSVHARVDGDRLVLDLSNSVPEIDGELTKQNFGDLEIVATDSVTQTKTTVGKFSYPDYDRASYEATSGIVTVPLAAGVGAVIAKQNLLIQQANGTVLAEESQFRAIPRTPNLYLDEGENGTAQFHVYERGTRVKAKVSLNLYQVGVNGSFGQPTSVQTDDDGVLSVPLSTTAGTVTSFVPSFSTADQPVPQQGINTQTNTYMYVRVRPADNDIAHLPPTWENVYARVLANWNAMAPCMDNWLKLNDSVQIRAYGPMLKKLTDPNRFESFRFMPVTRDMSAGERSLLYTFLDSAPEGDPVAKAAPPAVADLTPTPTLTALSRAMRRM